MKDSVPDLNVFGVIAQENRIHLFRFFEPDSPYCASSVHFGGDQKTYKFIRKPDANEIDAAKSHGLKEMLVTGRSHTYQDIPTVHSIDHDLMQQVETRIRSMIVTHKRSMLFEETR